MSKLLTHIAKFFKKRVEKSSYEDKNGINKLCDNPGTLHAQEVEIISNIQALTNYNVSDIMTPRTGIMGIDDDFTLEQICDQFIKSNHSKLLVYKRKKDDDEIIGYIALQDILPYLYSQSKKKKKFCIKGIIKKVVYVPNSKGAADLLYELKSKSVHIAVVLDEYGATTGIVTKGTLIEELIGRFEGGATISASDRIEIMDDGKIKVGGRAEIEEVEKVVKFSLSEEDGEYETFGGFILACTGRVPFSGEKIDYEGKMVIQITNADRRKINEAIIEISPSDEEEEEED